MYSEKKKDETRVYLELEKDISKTKLNKKKEIIRQPSTIYIHYAESIGLLLINFLNADFSSFESAYNTFYYKQRTLVFIVEVCYSKCV